MRGGVLADEMGERAAAHHARAGARLVQRYPHPAASPHRHDRVPAGMGKTIQAISVIVTHRTDDFAPHTVVPPAAAAVVAAKPQGPRPRIALPGAAAPAPAAAAKPSVAAPAGPADLPAPPGPSAPHPRAPVPQPQQQAAAGSRAEESGEESDEVVVVADLPSPAAGAAKAAAGGGSAAGAGAQGAQPGAGTSKKPEGGRKAGEFHADAPMVAPDEQVRLSCVCSLFLVHTVWPGSARTQSHSWVWW